MYEENLSHHVRLEKETRCEIFQAILVLNLINSTYKTTNISYIELYFCISLFEEQKSYTCIR